MLLKFTKSTYFLQVEKIDINYAKTAKKLDVKKLKGVIWHLLTTKSKAVNKENPEVSTEESGAEGSGENPIEVRQDLSTL